KIHEIRVTSDRRTFISGAEGVRGIFDQLDISLTGNRIQFIKVAGVTTPMHGNNGPRSPTDLSRDVVRIDISGVWIDISPNDLRARRHDRNIRGATGHRSRNHLVAGLDIGEAQSQL